MQAFAGVRNHAQDASSAVDEVRSLRRGSRLDRVAAD
jgi:hypothetical protein